MRRPFHLGNHAVVCALALALSALAPSAHAQTGKNADQQAVELFEKSVQAYRAGDFAKAVGLLKQAYALKPAPVLMYNLARAHEGLGQLDEAVRAYEDYLAKEPKPQDRGAIEKKVATLKAQIAERERMKREQEEQARRAAEAPPPEKRSPVPWIVAGIGGAVVIGGGVVMIMAKSKHDEADSEPMQTKTVALAEDAKSLSTVGSVVMLGGAAILATGVVWALVAPKRAADPSAAGIKPALGGFRVTW